MRSYDKEMPMSPPGENKTPTRPIRVPLDLWDRFGRAVERGEDKDRSAVLRDFMRWYARDPGSKMPRRPDAGPQTEVVP